MKTLLDALTSETAGFLLKLFSGIAAAAFGMLGIGTKTREDNGTFTPNGRIALIGIVVAGLLAIGTSVYDFVAGQQKAREDRLKSERLMLSVQRGLYPLRDTTAFLTIDVSSTGAWFDDYKSELLRALPPDNQCGAPNKLFICTGMQDSGGFIYQISPDSPLFPKQPSLAATALDSFNLVIGIGDERTKPILKGRTLISLRDIAPKDKILNFVPRTGKLTYLLNDFSISNSLIRALGVYSLADASSGFVFAKLATTVTTVKGCPHQLINCYFAITKLEQGSRINELYLLFTYPKALHLRRENDTSCDSSDGRHLVFLSLPDDVEHIDEMGDIHTFPEQHRTTICSAFENFGLY